jgi:hypothetical protein
MTEETEHQVPRPRGRPRNSNRASVREGPRAGQTYQGRDGEILTRTRRSGIDPFDVPKNFIPDGWEYQWCAIASYGNKEVVRTMNIEFQQNGWRPVPASRHDGYFMPAGESGPIIVRDQMLMERPSEMCEAARIEDKRNAIQQMRDRDESLMGGKANARKSQGIAEINRGRIAMNIDPALDIPMPSHKLAEPGD